MRCTWKVLFPALALLGTTATATRADIVLYSDTTTFAGLAYPPGGAALDGATSTSASTAMVADDITVGAGDAGATVNSFSFSVANLNSSSLSANVDIRFYSVGANGGPGTLLGGLNFNPITLGAGTVGLFTYASPSLFIVPTSGSFYVGEFFTNDSTTATATTAQLNNFGLGIFNPPTTGSSNDSFYQTSAGGSSNTANNPSGGLFNFSGNPAANFGFNFSGTPLATAVPEPGSFILVGLGLGAVLVARRRS